MPTRECSEPELACAPDLFRPAAAMPEGFEFCAELVSPRMELELLAHLGALDYQPFRFRGYEGKRRVRYFGWRYDFDAGKIDRAEELPACLLSLRDRAADFARLPPASLAHALVTEYPPGAPIGWHRDRPQFADVIGVSLGSAATFRMRRKRGGRWERRAIVLAPRSAYLLRGPARYDWEHSVPPAALRYSVTFRSLAPRPLRVDTALAGDR
jgi:alkylated DNA repair dioxygenase AlkB